MTGGLAPSFTVSEEDSQRAEGTLEEKGTLASAREGNEQRKAAESRLGPQI